MTKRERFDAARRRVLKAGAAESAHDEKLRRKYGPGLSGSWLTAKEYKERERLAARVNDSWDAMFALLREISPRNWESGIAAWWVVEELTYEDARANGPLSATPVPGYGYTAKDVAKFAGTIS